MLRLFKVNDPYLLVIVFIILILTRTVGIIYGLPLLEVEMKWLLLGERLANGFRMYSEAYDYTGPFAAYFYKTLDIVAGRSRIFHQVIASLIVMTQAGILNVILLRNSAFTENNYFPALFYVLCASALGDSYVLSPQLMSLTFILLSLNNIFRRIDNEVKDILFLYAGLYLGIAALFYFPAVLYFFILLVSLLLFSSPALRRLLLFFYGLIIPILLSYSYFYWFDAHWAFIDSYIFRGIFDELSFSIGRDSFFTAALPFLLLLVVILVIVYGVGRYANYQSKIQRVMTLTIFAGIVAVLVDVEFATHQLILFVPAISFFLAHYVLLLTRPLYKLVIPYLLVIGILLFPYYYYGTQEGKLPEITIESETKKSEKSLMYFGEGLGIYKEYEFASPFLDQRLSGFWLEKLDYYQPAEQVFDVVNRSAPDIIIDKVGAVDKLFLRFPLFESKYRKDGEIYRRTD